MLSILLTQCHVKTGWINHCEITASAWRTVLWRGIWPRHAQVTNYRYVPPSHPTIYLKPPLPQSTDFFFFSVCSPFRGTQLVYTLGERTDAAPSVRPFSIGSALTKGIHLLCYLSPLTSPLLDLRAESRALSFRELSLTSLLRQLWRSDWAESRDALPFDVTFEAADEREGRGEGGLCEGTFYRSYVACMVSYTPT